MALLYMDGFDAGDIAGKGWTQPGNLSSGTSPATRFGTGRWGSSAGGYLHSRPITTSSQVFVGVAMANTYMDAQLRTYITFLGDTGATQHITMGIGSTGFFLYRGNQFGTLIGSHSFGVVSGTFYHIETSVTIHSSTGNVVVKLNGNTIINFTGNTKNGGTNNSIDAFGIGSNGGVTSYFDDLWICNDTGAAPYNTFLGDCRIHTIVPNGVGSSTQLTPSSGANYTTVDELPYSATDYVYGTAGQTDLYATSDLPGGTGVIYGVQTNAVVKKTDAGTISARSALKSGASTYYSSSTSIGTTDQVVTRIDQTNPATSNAWSSGEVNSIEIGVGAV